MQYIPWFFLQKETAATEGVAAVCENMKLLTT